MSAVRELAARELARLGLAAVLTAERSVANDGRFLGDYEALASGGPREWVRPTAKPAAAAVLMACLAFLVLGNALFGPFVRPVGQ